MKKITVALLALLFTAAGGAFSAAAEAIPTVISTQGLGWYAHRTGAPTPSVMPEAASFFENYNAVFMDKSGEKSVILTFDSGYENGCTAKILDTLLEKGVTGAFFLDGNYVRRNPELVCRMAAEGHLVCNHSLRHPDMTTLTDLTAYRAQLEDWVALCRSIGVEPEMYFRPPSGRFSELTLSYDRQLGYKTVFWSVAYADWDVTKQASPQKAMQLLKARTHPGAIVLLHSVSVTNAEILGEYIDWLTAEGYAFKTLKEL